MLDSMITWMEFQSMCIYNNTVFNDMMYPIKVVKHSKLFQLANLIGKQNCNLPYRIHITIDFLLRKISVGDHCTVYCIGGIHWDWW